MFLHVINDKIVKELTEQQFIEAAQDYYRTTCTARTVEGLAVYMQATPRSFFVRSDKEGNEYYIHKSWAQTVGLE